MILLELFIGFLKVGCFAFGGAYGAIPLIRDVVLSYGWLDDEMLTYMIAVSESTPGPIMVNLATYVGSSQDGVLGSLVATLAVVLPSFIIILLVTALLVLMVRPLILTLVLGALYFGSRKIKKGGISPILLICISAAAGIAAYGL